MENKNSQNVEEITEDAEYLQQAEMLLSSGNYEQAAAYADKVLQMDERNFRAYLIKGSAFVYDNDLGRAEECFKRALLIDKKSGEAHYHMGSVCLLQGGTDQGIEEYQSALEYGYDYPELYFNLGLAYEEREDYEMAAHEYTRAIRRDSLNPMYYVRKVQLYMMQNRYEEALNVCEDLRKKCPDSFEGYHYPAQIYTILGDYESADNILRDAEEEFDADMDILMDRLKVLVAKSDLDEALREIEKARAMVDNDIQRKELELNLSKIYGMQGSMEECINTMEHALTMGAEEELDAELHYLLINAYQVKQDYQIMEEHAQVLENYDNRNPYALGAKYFKAHAAKELGRDDNRKLYKEAVRYYRSIALEDPNRVESYIYRAICQKEIGELEKALETIDYVMMFHKTGKLWVIKAGILKEMGRINESEEAFRNAQAAGEDISFWKEIG